MSCFDPRNETLSRDQLRQVQLERLQALLARLKRNMRRYRERLGDIHIESLSELRNLPATTPEDLVASVPYGMLALPLREVTRLHSTVGPAGRQVVIGHTRNDLMHWARLTARQLVAAGVTAHDVIQIRFSTGGFERAMGYMLGAEQIEASVIPEDPFHIEYQLAMLQNYRVTVLITTPQNARDLIDLLNDRKVEPQALHLRTLLLSRPVSPEERRLLQTELFSVVQCNFGVPEILDPGLCVECEDGKFHVNEDHFLVEVEDGELVVTTLCREAMPLLRYKTRIAATLEHAKCPCGRTGVVIRPGARRDQRYLINEIPLYAAQIRDALAHTPAAGLPFEITIGERNVRIALQVTDAIFADRMRSLADLKTQISADLYNRFGIEAIVVFINPRASAGP